MYDQFKKLDYQAEYAPHSLFAGKTGTNGGDIGHFNMTESHTVVASLK